MTLTEFLLARIAEDEDVANDVRPDEYLASRDDPTLSSADVGGYITVAITSGRVLAECEAKRQIVADCAEYEGPETDGLNWRVLMRLASVYADHPDYRDEWRL